MEIIEKDSKQESHYTNFIEDVAYTIMVEATKKMKDLIEGNIKTVDVSNYSREIGISVGQIILDDTIEATKDLSRDEIIKYLAHTVAALNTIMLNRTPGYKTRVLLKGKLFDS